MSVGRNQKNNADFFSHDADASSDEKVIYLESKFGHKGYALFFKFLECMARSDGFKLEWDEIKKAIYAAKFCVSVTEIEQFVTECCRDEIKAFVLENGFLYSPGLIKRFSGLISKREYNRQKYQEQKQDDKILQQKSSRKTQKVNSKGKESKGKESKEKEKQHAREGKKNGGVESGFQSDAEAEEERGENKNGGGYTKDFLEFWAAYPKRNGVKAGKGSAFKAWKKTANIRPPLKDLLEALEKHKNSKAWKQENGQYVPNASTWLNQWRWDDEISVEEAADVPNYVLESRAAAKAWRERVRREKEMGER